MKKQWNVVSILVVAAAMTQACGGGSKLPTAPSAPTPTVNPNPAQGVALSAATAYPIPNAVMVPPLTGSLSDQTIIEISAPGYYRLVTRVGHLRTKGNRIYLIPYSLPADYLYSMYYFQRIYQWDHRNITFQLKGNEWGGDGANLFAFGSSLLQMNLYLREVDSPAQVGILSSSTADFTVQFAPTLPENDPIQIYESVGPPVKGQLTDGSFYQGSIYIRDAATLNRTGRVLRELFRLVGPIDGAGPGKGFYSTTGFERFSAPTVDDLTILRAQMNRCAGTTLGGGYQNGYEDESGLTSCSIPH